MICRCFVYVLFMSSRHLIYGHRVHNLLNSISVDHIKCIIKPDDLHFKAVVYKSKLIVMIPANGAGILLFWQ